MGKNLVSLLEPEDHTSSPNGAQWLFLLGKSEDTPRKNQTQSPRVSQACPNQIEAKRPPSVLELASHRQNALKEKKIKQ
tara:strand:+ start:258 stop:494 length:237 start_codon:yes stop_codon:yes gene_type:complete